MAGNTEVVYTVSTNLVDFIGVAHTFNVKVTYSCPASESFSGTVGQSFFTNPINYGLNGDLISFQASDFFIHP